MVTVVTELLHIEDRFQQTACSMCMISYVLMLTIMKEVYIVVTQFGSYYAIMHLLARNKFFIVE